MNRELLNITLRRIAVGDAELVEKWRNQATSVRYQASPPRSLEQVRLMLEEQATIPIRPEASGRFGWVILVNGVPSGTIQFTINSDYDRRHSNATLGYMVAEEMHGRGVATVAVRQILEIGFDPDGLALERVEAVAAVDNVASRRVLEKAGFTLEGIRRKLLIIDGQRADHASYSRLRSDTESGDSH